MSTPEVLPKTLPTGVQARPSWLISTKVSSTSGPTSKIHRSLSVLPLPVGRLSTNSSVIEPPSPSDADWDACPVQLGGPTVSAELRWAAVGSVPKPRASPALSARPRSAPPARRRR
jgi:hypothetical protein